MMERDWGCTHLVQTHQCDFTSKKFGIMGWPDEEEKNPQGHPATVPVVRKPVSIQQTWSSHAEHKFLSVILDQELRWNSHVNYTLPKAQWSPNTVTSHTHKGTSAKHMRRFYITIAIPICIHSWPLPHSAVWTSPWIQGPHKEIGESTATGHSPCNQSPKNDPTDSLDAHTDLLPFQ